MNKLVVALVGISLITASVLAANNGVVSKPFTKVIPSDNNPVVTNSTSPTQEKSIKQLDLSADNVVTISGPIGAEASDVAAKITELCKKNKDVYVLLNSPGGSVLDGAMIVSSIEACRSNLYTVNIGLSASMAAIIHSYGTKRYAVDRSILMFHPASGGVSGTLEQMHSRLSSITTFINKMTTHIAKRSGLTFTQFHDMYISELWLDAEDAFQQKFVDEIVNVSVNGQKLNLTSSENTKKMTILEQPVTVKEKINVNW